ncbi:MAG: tRNA (adenosine(37)-N6)-threonylcarbamoyltransferase complex transferase subunit TsaD [bacterium]
MIILGIETSCDETAICIIEIDNTEKIKILGNQLYSQIAIHAQYGGVFPMMAKREHIKNVTFLLEQCLIESNFFKFKKQNKESKINEEKEQKIKEILIREQTLFELFIKLIEKIEKPNIDFIAITNGPGLEPALWVGVSFAKALSEIWNIPIIPINHMEGHIVSAQIIDIAEGRRLDAEKHRKNTNSNINLYKTNTNNTELLLESKSYQFKIINYPAIALLISGGHTQLVLIKENLNYEIIGNTKDDAIGEAFDKVARILGLPYPGGPQISKLAEKERTENPDKISPYILPRPMIHSGDFNFSFSGIKTAVLYTTQKIKNITDNIKQEIAKEFEDAVVEVIIKKTKQAVEQYGAQTIIIGGGVSANKKIRDDFTKLAKNLNVEFLVPEISASTDNAFMIALAGYINIKSNKKFETDFTAKGNLVL